MTAKTPGKRALGVKAMAILGVLLIALFSTVEAVHMHPDMLAPGGQNAHDANCTLCVAAHTVAALTAVSVAPAVVFLLVFVVFSEPQPQSHLFALTVSIRPPPVSA